MFYPLTDFFLPFWTPARAGDEEGSGGPPSHSAGPVEGGTGGGGTRKVHSQVRGPLEDLSPMTIPDPLLCCFLLKLHLQHDPKPEDPVPEGVP